MTLRYRLHFRRDGDDGDPAFYTADNPVQLGQVLVLPETGYYHLVCAITLQKTGQRLDLSKSSSSNDEALMLAEQYGDWPPAKH